MTDQNRHPKQQPLPAAEWFDFDRDVKMKEKLPKTDYKHWIGVANRDGWRFPPELCPHCKNGMVIRDPIKIGYSPTGKDKCHCSSCDKLWLSDSP